MMAGAAERWDQRYKTSGHYPGVQEPRQFLVDCASFLPDQGIALDAACGLGNNAAYLIKHGIKVVGVDISAVGIHAAHSFLPALLAVQADLSRFNFPPSCFDVIVNFYFLERSLFEKIPRWLKPGGLLVFETLTTHILEVKPELNPEYLLEPGELRQAFSAWDILRYEESWITIPNGKNKATASLLARLPMDR